MTVWATRADQVDLRAPNPHDLASSLAEVGRDRREGAARRRDDGRERHGRGSGSRQSADEAIEPQIGAKLAAVPPLEQGDPAPREREEGQPADIGPRRAGLRNLPPDHQEEIQLAGGPAGSGRREADPGRPLGRYQDGAHRGDDHAKQEDGCAQPEISGLAPMALEPPERWGQYDDLDGEQGQKERPKDPYRC